MKIQEAAAYIEKKNHPKLWALLAEVALNQLNLETAEHAFVMLKDYGGIQFIKRIKAIQVFVILGQICMQISNYLNNLQYRCNSFWSTLIKLWF